MPTPIKWKDSFQVNTGDAGLGIQSDARIIGLSNGRILVAWTESATGIIGSGAGKNIIGQYLDFQGNRFGVPFQINTLSTADDEMDFDIAATSDGFVVVYVDDDIGTERTSIVWERHDSSGALHTLRVADETSADYDFESPQVAVNQLTNQSMVTYTRSENGDADVLGVVVSAAGAAGAGFDAADNDEFASSGGDVAILANGNYVAVFRDTPTGGGVSEAGWRIMTSTGAEVATFTVHDPAIEIKVATLVNGNWVMAYWQGAIIGGDIRFQIWTPTGGTASNTVIVATGGDNHRDPDIVALPDGGFVVLWQNATADTLLARRFTSTGASDGTVFTVATSVTGEPDVAVTGDGRVLFAWTDEASQEVFASIWDPRSPTINAIDYQANDRNFVETLYVTGGIGASVINGNGIAGAVLIGQGGDDNIFGGANNQTLIGNGGSDTLIGGGSDPNVGIGGDIMQGGEGNDTYVVNSNLDYIDELADAGNDTLLAATSYVLSPIVNGANVETLATIDQAATTAINLTGNSLSQTMRGNEGANILRGEDGNDILSGFGGSDFLVGGGGADVMIGGFGNDTYYFDDAGDALTEFAGQGSDRVAATITLALAADADIERLDVEDLTSTNAIDLTGSGIANVIYGNNGVNILRGEAGNDELRGFGGNDFLVGGAGTDVMIGGTGSDTFYVDDASDAIGENPGEGNDRIAASVSFVLSNGASVELLEAVNVASTSAFDLTGSDSNNTITGNAGVNILRGEGGADTLSGAGGDDFLVGGAGNDNMSGGTGNDTYYVDAIGDVVNEFAAEGTADRVVASASYALSANANVELLETATQSGTTAINLVGSSIANVINGNDGANVLDGREGSDTLSGFGGADTFQFGTALGASNVDTILGFASGSDKLALDDAIFAAVGAPGALNANAFFAGTAAHDADDRIVYNSTTGALFYDADGNGAGAAVQFASLQGAPALSAGDFAII